MFHVKQSAPPLLFDLLDASLCYGSTCKTRPCAMVRPARLVLVLQLTNHSSPTTAHQPSLKGTSFGLLEKGISDSSGNDKNVSRETSLDSHLLLFPTFQGGVPHSGNSFSSRTIFQSLSFPTLKAGVP